MTRSVHSSPRPLHAWLLAVSAWAWVGATVGLLAGYLTVQRNQSIALEGNGLRFAGAVATVYAALFAFGALASRVVGRVGPWRNASHRRAAPAASLAARASAEIITAATCGAILAIGFHLAGQPPLKTVELPFQIATLLAALLATAPMTSRIATGLRRASVSRILPVALALSGVALVAALRPASRPEPVAVVPPVAASAAGARVFVIGLDGADWRRIRPLVAQGRLPAFAALMRNGVAAPLVSMKPTLSPILWTTIATGMSENQHGVNGFMEVSVPGLSCGVQQLSNFNLLPQYVGMRPLVREALRREWLVQVPISSCHRRVKALWNILSERGRRVAVVNWWGTWPSEPVNGFLVSDNNPNRAARMEKRFGHTNPLTFGVTYPNSLMAELAEGIGAGELESGDILASPFFADLSATERADLESKPKNQVAFRLIDGADAFSAAAGLQLLRKDHVDFLAVYLPGIDNVSHLFPFARGVVDHYYERVDRWLAEYVAQADDHTTVVLVSDHGWDYERGGLSGHEHAPDGILLMSGYSIRAGAQLAPAPTLLDVTPTLLALLGLPRATDMPGRVLTEALQPEVVASIPPTSLASYGPYSPPTRLRGTDAPELTDETTEKLRALGYVK
ncbi:MAG: alkaline phosphatase family protein [Deltaproteobacteria bacterium]|nr:alkaline phosphatase family protein [Deltaproteobacteria bacterium]MBI3386482.1 alkaline phosphatase family protein [Deltaproteobacteria bacterium]